MSNLDKLKSAKNRKNLAKILGFRPSALTSIVYQTPLEEKYTIFTIPKKSGGVRTIKAPTPKLKKLQSHLAYCLDSCFSEIQKGRRAASVAYGFRKGGTIVANAKSHKRRRFVLNLDLKDFFPSFNFGRVRGFFLKDKAFTLEDEVATTIAQIACDGVALPQGSPSSPIISELIGQILDLRLLRFAKKHGVRYSRYADDLTFSTNQKEFPPIIAQQDAENLSSWTLGNELVGKIESSGFMINAGKTRMQFRSSRQTVTGLVVNEKVNIRSEYYRQARAMCDSLFHTGQYFKGVVKSDNPNKDTQPDLTDNINPLDGILSHIYYVTQSEERRPVGDQRKKPRAIIKLYRRFMFYKYCVALNRPLIVTEGKTDPVYLREAIRHRTGYHPRLGQFGQQGFELSIKFFNYVGQAQEIMDLGGGSGNLKSIPLDYLRNLDPNRIGRRPFSHKPMAHPVILVLDNDDGLSGVTGTIKKHFGVTITVCTNADFYHITKNLYLVKTPENSGKSCIEDMFSKDVLNTMLNNKKFSTDSKINPETQYSKEIFANKIIKPNSENIDFSGFDPLLNRIVAVLDDYSAQQ